MSSHEINPHGEHSHEEKAWWLDTYWPALLITLGIAFVATVIIAHPVQ